MAISEERWKVRTRMLEERVNALSKQLASERENSARFHIEHQESTAKVCVSSSSSSSCKFIH
jgi:hypothetical protein